MWIVGLKLFRRRLIDDLVVAGFTAGQAIVKAILAEADFELRIAETAITLAFAAVFRHLALRTVCLGFGRGHTASL